MLFTYSSQYDYSGDKGEKGNAGLRGYPGDTVGPLAIAKGDKGDKGVTGEPGKYYSSLKCQ